MTSRTLVPGPARAGMRRSCKEAMILGGKVIVATRAIIIRATDRNPHPLPRAPAAVGGWQTRAGGNGAGHLVRHVSGQVA